MGLFKQQNSKNWRFKKVVIYKDKRLELRESTGTSNKQLAERIMQTRVNEEMERMIYGIRYPFTFEDGACQLLNTCSEKRKRDLVSLLDGLMPFLADVVLGEIHNQHPQLIAFKASLDGRKNNTVNRYLEVLRTILNRAATLWIHDNQTWIAHAPKIILLPRDDESGGYPLSFGQQRELFKLLPEHYKLLATVAVNCGARLGELLSLKWDYEQTINNVFVFAIPTSKNGQPKRLFLNSEARRAIDQCRGKHPEHVFTFKGNLLKSVGKGWNNARKKAGLDNVRGLGQHFRFHDLRHTCATRLRECGISKEDRADILGHKSTDITTHYSSGEVMHLINCVETTIGMREQPTLYVATNSHCR